MRNEASVWTKNFFQIEDIKRQLNTWKCHWFVNLNFETIIRSKAEGRYRRQTENKSIFT
jgi:hypothetical protein